MWYVLGAVLGYYILGGIIFVIFGDNELNVSKGERIIYGVLGTIGGVLITSLLL